MSLRITFVQPDFPHFDEPDYGGTFAHGVASMTAVLRRAGHTVKLLHFVRPPSRDELAAKLRESAPDLIGFSSITHYFPFVREWIGWARAVAAAPIIVGGVHAILSPEEVMAAPEVDFACTGEGELTLLDLCGRIEAGDGAGNVAGTWSRVNGAIQRNPARPLIENLDELPFPDYSIFEYPALYEARHRRLPVMVSRGCAYRCAYCANATLRQAYPNSRHYARFMSPARAVEHLERLIAQFPETRQVQFNDNILYGSHRWLSEFSELYRSRIGLPFTANLRPGLATPETALLLRKAGCRLVCLGVESGSEAVANGILKRDLSNATIEGAFRALNAAGVETVSYNILGAPFETPDTMLETVRLNARIRPTSVAAFIFYPFPGTECHRLCEENGFLTGRQALHNNDLVMIRQPTLTDDEVLFMHRFFRHLVKLYRLAYAIPVLGSGLAAILDHLLKSRWLPRRAILDLRDRTRIPRRLVHQLMNSSTRLV